MPTEKQPIGNIAMRNLDLKQLALALQSKELNALLHTQKTFRKLR